jgi:hypothetical protein
MSEMLERNVNCKCDNKKYISIRKIFVHLFIAVFFILIIGIWNKGYLSQSNVSDKYYDEVFSMVDSHDILTRNFEMDTIYDNKFHFKIKFNLKFDGDKEAIARYSKKKDEIENNLVAVLQKSYEDMSIKQGFFKFVDGESTFYHPFDQYPDFVALVGDLPFNITTRIVVSRKVSYMKRDIDYMRPL